MDLVAMAEAFINCEPMTNPVYNEYFLNYVGGRYPIAYNHGLYHLLHDNNLIDMCVYCGDYIKPNVIELVGGSASVCDSCTQSLITHNGELGMPSEFDDWDDDYDDDEEDEDEYGVDSYHSNNRDLLFKGVNMRDPFLLGLEIETCFNRDQDVGSAAREAADISGGFAERDGSLDDVFGVEFIFKPTTLKMMTPKSPIKKWCDFMQNKAIAWDAGPDYGMHISVNASAMSQLHCCKICYFINSNPKLCSKIAGRKSSYAIFEDYSMDYYRQETDKFLAASRRDKNRIEIRIFRASLNWSRIYRNCEFVDSVLRFTKRTSASKLTLENYFKFLSRRNYKNLSAFIESKELVKVG